MNEQPLNLRASVQEMWRRRRLLLIAAVVGALAGLLIGFLRPSEPNAVALVLLPPSAASTGGAPADDIHTGAVIARSTPVLAAAGAKVSPPLGATALRNLVTVTALSGQILQIQARAAQSSYAAQLSNAVAGSFVNYIGQLQSTSTGTGVATLQQESALFTQQIKDLQSQIDTVSSRIASEGANSSAGQQDASLLSSLQNEQNQVSLQLNNVTNQIAAAQLANGAGENTTRILQPATTETASKDGALIMAGLVGALIGLLGGMAFLLVRLQRNPRLRLRDEIARAAGAPVVASLESPLCSTPSTWRDLLATRPRATDEWGLRHVLHLVLRETRQCQVVRVISFAGDTSALSTGPRLAVFAAASGTSTVLAPNGSEGEDRPLAPLRAAFTGWDRLARGLPLTLGLDESMAHPPQLVVSVVLTGRRTGCSSSPSTMSLLSITPDFATRDQLAQLVLDAADSGSSLDGVVVVNPDPTDRTSGLIADDTLRPLISDSRPDRDEKELVRNWAQGQRDERCRRPTLEPGALMVVTMGSVDSGMGPMIGLRSLTKTIWQNRRLWLLTALLGMILGASLHLVVPQKYSAVTDLYLALPSGADPVQAMANDVALLQTQAVAEQAVAANHLDVSPSSFLSHYSGLALSNDILSIKFNGASQGNALSGAREAAQAFLAVQARELGLQTDVLVRGLHSQISTLNSAINGLNTQINVLSAAPTANQASSQLTDLVNQRSADATQVSQLQTQVNQALQNQHSADNVSHVLDPAALAPMSVKRAIVEDALSGLIVGLAIGLVVVIFRELLAERAIDRSIVAVTLGAPVELSLGRYKTPRVMRGRRLSRQLRNPSPALRMIERRLRGHLESAPGSTLAVVATGTSEPAALAVGRLALDLSAEGHEVVVVDAADGRPLAELLGLTATPQTMEIHESPAPGGPPVRVVVAPEDPAQMAQKSPPDDADAVVILVTLDPGFGADHLASWVTDAVMILRPRGLPYSRITAYRDMLRAAGVSLRSVLLIGADADDDSSGALGAVDDVRLTPVNSPATSK